LLGLKVLRERHSQHATGEPCRLICFDVGWVLSIDVERIVCGPGVAIQARAGGDVRCLIELWGHAVPKERSKYGYRCYDADQRYLDERRPAAESHTITEG
jgi:hypothetical protein